ncbi:hypothetical protein C8R45DRAFT_1089229 [Mycena sanguinolenta]|nr:hypothetical protein C8R45DRAFT_1089229 [Mycena sanguinolenta]
MGPRAASRAISANISAIAVNNITASDADMEVTVVAISGGEEDQNAYNDVEKDSDASSSSSSSDSSSSEDESDAPKKPRGKKDKFKSVQVPAKRKHSKKIDSDVNDSDADSDGEESRKKKKKPVARPIEYTTTIYTAQQLIDHTAYKHLVSNALKIKSTPKAKIIIEPKAVSNDKENDDDDKDKGKKKKNKGTKVRHERDILPANVALNAKISALREWWLCPTPNGRCGSQHCFVHPDEVPAQPRTSGELGCCDAFDRVNAKGLAERSPLLKRRAELNQKATSNTSPQIHINIPPEFAGLFSHPAAPPNAPAPVHAANGPAMLIPPDAAAGPSLTIEDFCAVRS